MRDRMKLLVTATFAGGAFTAPALAAVVYNLPLLLAFDVLGQVLAQLRDEAQITCARSQLGPLVDAAKSALPWLDWQAIRDGVHRRSEVAHDGVLLDSNMCVADIVCVEKQLIAWRIIDAA